jgi:hypothetical protein
MRGNSVGAMTLFSPVSRTVAALVAITMVAGLTACSGSPTSSPDNAVRAFMDAMKSNDLEAAIAVTGSELTMFDGDEFIPVPNDEQAAAPTGVTGYEIVDLSQETETRARVTVEIAGGAVPQMKFSVNRAGADGEQWLITHSEPAMTALKISVPEHWSATLAGGTEYSKVEDFRLLMFPGTHLDGLGTWNDDDGYFEPVEFSSQDHSDVVRYSPLRPLVNVPTAKLQAEAQAAMDAALRAQVEEVVGKAGAQGAYARVVEAPSIAVTAVLPMGAETAHVVTDVSWGRVESCRIVRAPWQVLGGGTPTVVTESFHANNQTLAVGETTSEEINFSPYQVPQIQADLFSFFASENALSECAQ